MDSLKALRERADKATPGKRQVQEGGSIVTVLADGKHLAQVGNQGYWEKFTPQDLSNAAFIAAANPEVVKALVDVALAIEPIPGMREKGLGDQHRVLNLMRGTVRNALTRLNEVLQDNEQGEKQ